MTEGLSMKVKYWGVRGSIPTPLTTEQIRAKQERLIRDIVSRGGIEGLFGVQSRRLIKDQIPFDGPQNDLTSEMIQAYLNGLPLSVSGTYGGDTTCVEIQVKDSPLIILDAGTGIRDLGNTLVRKLFTGENFNPLSTDETSKKQVHLLFSHYHWDHIQGVPFFTPAFIPGVDINFYGKQSGRGKLNEVLAGQQEFPTFPVVWSDMACNKEYHELPRMGSGPIMIGKAKVTYAELDHPDGVISYAVEAGGKKFVFATDTEHRDIPDPLLVNLAKGANVLYYDSHYTPEEYRGDKGTLTGTIPKLRWGHSTYEWAIRTALAADVKTVVLGHIEPLRGDFGVEDLYRRALIFKESELKLPGNRGKDLEVLMGFQGLEHRL